MTRAPSLADYATPRDVSLRSAKWIAVHRWCRAGFVTIHAAVLPTWAIVVLTKAGREEVEKARLSPYLRLLVKGDVLRHTEGEEPIPYAVGTELLRRGWVRHGVVVTHGIATLRRSAWQITELGRQQVEKDNGHG